MEFGALIVVAKPTCCNTYCRCCLALTTYYGKKSKKCRGFAAEGNLCVSPVAVAGREGERRLVAALVPARAPLPAPHRHRSHPESVVRSIFVFFPIAQQWGLLGTLGHSRLEGEVSKAAEQRRCRFTGPASAQSFRIDGHAAGVFFKQLLIK